MAGNQVVFRGLRCCPCLAQWLPWAEREYARRKGYSDTWRIPRIYQLFSNGVGASAGTHDGGAFDVDLRDEVWLKVCEDMGAATWSRTDGFVTKHSHGVLKGCVHNGPARYQVYAREAGFNGLGVGGKLGYDPRGKITLRTWAQGIEWAKSKNITGLQKEFNPWWPEEFKF